MDRIQCHLEESKEKLDSAKLLLENEYFKDAVSRAYYCMYNAARALLLTKDMSPKTHKGLISKFGEEFMKMEDDARSYATSLHKAEDLREMADYGLYKEIS
ncbi:MAG: HEPN domain-containing protein [Candidatus Methanoperedens sp.]|nr:HEPN domain-containing protein [Candidatus Methanoperedens sp.]